MLTVGIAPDRLEVWLLTVGIAPNRLEVWLLTVGILPDRLEAWLLRDTVRSRTCLFDVSFDLINVGIDTDAHQDIICDRCEPCVVEVVHFDIDFETHVLEKYLFAHAKRVEC